MQAFLCTGGMRAMSASTSVQKHLKAPESGTPCGAPGIGEGWSGLQHEKFTG